GAGRRTRAEGRDGRSHDLEPDRRPADARLGPRRPLRLRLRRAVEEGRLARGGRLLFVGRVLLHLFLGRPEERADRRPLHADVSERRPEAPRGTQAADLRGVDRGEMSRGAPPMTWRTALPILFASLYPAAAAADEPAVRVSEVTIRGD